MTSLDELDGAITANDAFGADERYLRGVSNPQGWAECPFQACASEWTFMAAKSGE